MAVFVLAYGAVLVVGLAAGLALVYFAVQEDRRPEQPERPEPPARPRYDWW